MNKEVDINTYWEKVKELLLSTKRPGIEELVDWLDKSDFKYAPASTQYHGSYYGGLIEHSLNVYQEVLRQKDLINLFNIPKESLILTALLHDICKVNYYKMEKANKKVNGAWVEYDRYTVDDLFPMGHSEKSIIVIQQFISLNEVEIAMIRGHMGGFVSDQYFSPSSLYNKFPEAIILQFAEMVSTYVLESPGLLDEFKNKLPEFINKV